MILYFFELKLEPISNVSKMSFVSSKVETQENYSLVQVVEPHLTFSGVFMLSQFTCSLLSCINQVVTDNGFFSIFYGRYVFELIFATISLSFI